MEVFGRWGYGLNKERKKLTEARNARQNVDIAVDDGDGDPEIVAHEEGLPGRVARLVRRQLDHAHARRAGGRVDVPAEVGLGLPVPAQSLHALEGLGVQLQLQAERLGDGLVGDVVVSAPVCLSPNEMSSL